MSAASVPLLDFDVTNIRSKTQFSKLQADYFGRLILCRDAKIVNNNDIANKCNNITLSFARG